MPRCRCEYFVFSLWAEMLGKLVELHAIKLDGSLNLYPEVKVENEIFMPSEGNLSNPKDKDSVKGLEDTMIAAYGKAIAVAKCKQGVAVDLRSKMIRDVHMEALGKALDEYKVKELDLETNQLGVDGAKALALFLNTNSSLTSLKCATPLLTPDCT